VVAPDPELPAILAGVRERFEDSTDLTVGIEEEYQLLDPASLALVNRYEELVEAAEPALRERLAGELIASEVEFKTVAHRTFADAARELVRGRLDVIELAERLGMSVGVSGVHPFSPWTEQRIIDTPHYRRLDQELGYVAWTNNTWALHLHCGVRGADRAIGVTSALRSVLPELLALSANSPVFEGTATRLASTRTQVFVRSFPRCGIPDGFLDWDDYAEHVALLARTNSITESTQIWWSIRPHHAFGTVEIRICDGQTDMSEVLGVAALMLACVAQTCRDHDEGRPLPIHPSRLIEENLWRAQRHGLRGRLIDLERGEERPTPAALEALLRWAEPAVEQLALEPFLSAVERMLAEGNGAVRQMRVLEASGGDVRAVVADVVARTRASAREAATLMDAVAAPHA
jgi:carboxylate-amine ligase